MIIYILECSNKTIMGFRERENIQSSWGEKYNIEM